MQVKKLQSVKALDEEAYIIWRDMQVSICYNQSNLQFKGKQGLK